MSRIAMSYAELEAAYTQINSESDAMEGTLEDLRTRLDNMDWDGADLEAYNEAKSQWDDAFNGLNEILKGVSNAVKNAMERYQETEASNAAKFQ